MGELSISIARPGRLRKAFEAASPDFRIPVVGFTGQTRRRDEHCSSAFAGAKDPSFRTAFF